MKPHVCFIGDSHVAALRQAMDDERCASFLERTTIFGSQGQTLHTCALDGRHIVSDEKKVRKNFRMTGGRKYIDLDRYDAYCVVGCQVEMDLFEPVFQQYCPVETGLPERQPVSSALFDVMFQEILKTTIAYKLVQMLATSGKPVYQILNARYSDDILYHSSGAFFRELIDNRLDDYFLERFRRAVETVFGPHTTLVDQPQATLSSRLFTSRAFSSGSKRLGKGLKDHPDDDFHHMNAEYGVLVLAHAFGLIDADDAG